MVTKSAGFTEHTAEKCAEWYYCVPGWWYGSNWNWVPCQEPGHSAPPEAIDPTATPAITLVPR